MTTEELIAALRALAADLGRHPGAATATDAADRLEALTAPVEGMTLETTEEERTRFLGECQDNVSFDVEPYAFARKLIRDFDRLSSALAAERDRSVERWHEIERLRIANKNLATITHDVRDRNERLAGALRFAKSALVASDHTRAFTEIDAALSQEKQTS